MNNDIIHRPTALENLLAGRIWPAGRRLPMHVLEHDHVIDCKNVEILNSEPHANRRRTAKSFLINQKAKEFNVLNRSDSAILPGVYKTLLNC